MTRVTRFAKVALLVSAVSSAVPAIGAVTPIANRNSFRIGDARRAVHRPEPAAGPAPEGHFRPRLCAHLPRRGGARSAA